MLIEGKIKEIIEEFSNWAIKQSSDVWYVEMFKSLYISDLHGNVIKAKNIRDKIYWIKVCTRHFEEKFKVKMPSEIDKKIVQLDFLNSFEK